MSVVDVLLANTNVAKQQIMRKQNFSKTLVDALNLLTLYELPLVKLNTTMGWQLRKLWLTLPVCGRG